ncbi:hypothetical protein GOODEAATRI_025055 [Goodea atripinnis]|uniref:Uncharacterized protein n=1 Tax=Goodea atripinnis TaxID=208336 RepID=A0ABV0Q0V9_9TELE
MSAVRRSVSEAFWAMCAADSMSMPVHWYYNIQDIRRDFGGWISGFNTPADRHPSSILSLSNTAGSGRSAWSTGAKRADVVGNIILHEKLELWRSSNGSVHYHQGAENSKCLQAGDNTLNILCSLRVARTIVSRRFTDVSQPDARAAVLSDYVQFLTTPGSHADTYAESFHRSFFADWQDSRPTSPSEVSAAVEFVKLTHPHPNVPEYVKIYSRALHAVLGGGSVRQQAEYALRRLEVWDTCQSYSYKASRFPASSEERLKVHQSAVNQLGLACYNRGENCNRGSALGALLGAGAAYNGGGIPQEWKDELRAAQELLPDILKKML